MAWFWLALACAVAPLAVASVRGRWLIAAIPFASFAWGFGQEVLLGDLDTVERLPRGAWLAGLVGLEAATAVPPKAGSWWVLRYRSWRGWRKNPGGVLAVLLAAWLALGQVPLLGEVLSWGVVGVPLMIVVISIAATTSAVRGKSRSAEMLALTTGSAALPIAAVLAARLAGAFMLGL